MTASALASLWAQWRAAEAELSDPTPTERLAAFVRSQVPFHIDRHREAVITNAQLARLRNLSPEHSAGQLPCARNTRTSSPTSS
jgi:hypothetical protein